MLQNLFSITNEVKTLQGLLHIQENDYGLDGESAIRQILQRLGGAYTIDLLNTKLTDPQNSMVLGVSQLIENIGAVYARVTAYTALQRYYNQSTVQIRNIGHLGFAEHSTAQFLAACNSARYAEQLDSPIRAITLKYDTLSISLERQLTLILLLMYRLGLYEFTGAIADLFLLGMLTGKE